MCSEKLLTCLRVHSKKVAELNSSSGLLTPLIRWMKPGPDCLSSPTLYSWPLLACPVPGSWSQNHTLPISWDSSSSYMISNSLSNCPYKSASVISIFPHLNLVSQTVYCSWKWLKNSFRLSVLTWSLDNTCTPRARWLLPDLQQSDNLVIQSAAQRRMYGQVSHLSPHFLGQVLDQVTCRQGNKHRG